MSKPFSPESQEIVDVVREHGPIDSRGIAERVTLLTDRSEIATRLHSLRTGGHLLRGPDKAYRVNGKNGTAQTQNAAEPPPDPIPERRFAEIVDKFIRRPPPGTATPEPEPPTRTEPVTESTPETAEREAREHLHRLQTQRPHDALLMDDPIEHILRDAVDTAQRNLDAFVREAGSLARVLTCLIEARDKTVAALNDYRKTTA